MVQNLLRASTLEVEISFTRRPQDGILVLYTCTSERLGFNLQNLDEWEKVGSVRISRVDKHALQCLHD